MTPTATRAARGEAENGSLMPTTSKGGEGRTKIGKGFTVDSAKLKVYLDHLTLRMAGMGEGPIEDREKERTQLHNEAMATVQPQRGADEALRNYIEDELGGATALIGFREVSQAYASMLGYDKTCPLCYKPLAKHGPHKECP